jgi:hypothetical protein
VRVGWRPVRTGSLKGGPSPGSLGSSPGVRGGRPSRPAECGFQVPRTGQDRCLSMGDRMAPKETWMACRWTWAQSLQRGPQGAMESRRSALHLLDIERVPDSKPTDRSSLPAVENGPVVSPAKCAAGMPGPPLATGSIPRSSGPVPADPGPTSGLLRRPCGPSQGSQGRPRGAASSPIQRVPDPSPGPRNSIAAPFHPRGGQEPEKRLPDPPGADSDELRAPGSGPGSAPRSASPGPYATL